MERRIARSAGRQDTAIGLEQLLEAGLGHDAAVVSHPSAAEMFGLLPESDRAIGFTARAR